MTIAVESRALWKKYGNFVSLRDCNLTIPSGIVFGLLGPNGAGKSTLLRTLLGFMRPTSGGAKVCGFDIVSESLQVRAATAYLPGDARLYRTMRGSSLIDMFAGLHPCSSVERCREAAKRLDLDVSRRVMFMSTGMRQKLALAIVLGCTAPLVVLDEPTANLDPNVRAVVLELVQEVKREGRTVVLSSHIFSDIDETCDEVAILRQGEVVVQKSMAEVGQKHIVKAQLNPDATRDLLEAGLGGQPSVDFSHIAARSESAADVVLHLSGQPGEWLNWLASLHLEDIQIERAGVRALYQQYNASGSTAIDASGRAI